MVRQTVSWVAHYFSTFSLKLAENEYFSKLEKEFRFQVITLQPYLILQSIPYIRYPRVFAILSRTNSEFWHIQNARYIKNSFNIPCETLLIHAKSWYTENLRHIQNNVNLQNKVYTEFSVTLPFKNQRHIQNPIKYL